MERLSCFLASHRCYWRKSCLKCKEPSSSASISITLSFALVWHLYYFSRLTTSQSTHFKAAVFLLAVFMLMYGVVPLIMTPISKNARRITVTLIAKLCPPAAFLLLSVVRRIPFYIADRSSRPATKRWTRPSSISRHLFPTATEVQRASIVTTVKKRIHGSADMYSPLRTQLQAS